MSAPPPFPPAAAAPKAKTIQAQEDDLITVENLLETLKKQIDWTTAPKDLQAKFTEAEKILEALLGPAVPQNAGSY